MAKTFVGKAPISETVKKLLKDGYGHELLIKSLHNDKFEVNGIKFYTKRAK